MSEPFDRWRSQVLNTAVRLDEIDYFSLLGCPQTVVPADLRQAFRGLAQSYHPDALVSEDEELTAAVEAIYRRLTEAYAVLRQPSQRQAYIAGLAQGLTRYDPEKSQSALKDFQAKQAPGRSDSGRLHFQRAQRAAAQGDRFSAAAEMRLALLYEPNEPGFLNFAQKLGIVAR
jgi:DnaJ-class molecular chaperone